MDRIRNDSLLLRPDKKIQVDTLLDTHQSFYAYPRETAQTKTGKITRGHERRQIVRRPPGPSFRARLFGPLYIFHDCQYIVRGQFFQIYYFSRLLIDGPY